MTRVRVALAIITALVLPRVAAAQYRGQPTGLTLIDHPWDHPGQYVENISEEGYGAILSTAALLSGGSSLRVARTSQGGIVQTYTVDTCSLPTSDEKQREKNRICRQATGAKLKVWMTFLRARADADGSGFITDEEGAAVFSEVMMAFHVIKLEITSPTALLGILDYRGQTKSSILAKLAAYTKLRDQALDESLTGMPELPAPLAQATRMMNRASGM